MGAKSLDPARLHDVLAFVAAVQAGGFSAAAREMGLARSVVGKSVARLESSVGVRLLNRTTRQISLTDDGAIAFERWRQILDDLAEVDATLAQRRGRPTGLLRLTAPIALGHTMVLPVLQNLLQRWPELTAEVHFSPRYVDVIAEGFDVAVRVGAPDENVELQARTIGKQQFVTCGSPQYLEDHGTPQCPRDLTKHSKIAFLKGEGPPSWRFKHDGQLQVLDVVPRLCMDSGEALMRAGVMGLGLLHLPTYVVGEALGNGSLVEVLADYRPPPDLIRVVYPSKRQLSPRVRTFIDALVEMLPEP